jgi:hypothetical protein
VPIAQAVTGFILFQGRLLNTAHVVSVNAPRPEGGKHVIEARVVGGVTYAEEFDDDDEAAGRYLALASQLLDDPSIASGVKHPPLAEVTPLPTRQHPPSS